MSIRLLVIAGVVAACAVSAADVPPHLDQLGQFARLRQYPTWALLFTAIILAWPSWATLSAAARDPLVRRDTVFAGVMLGGFTLFALTVAAADPSHDHASFLRRSNCAFDPACDTSVAWHAPVLHNYGLLFRTFGVDVDSRAMISLALSVAALGALFAVVRQLYALCSHAEEGRRVAYWALGFACCSPLLLRLSVSGTFWPYSMVTLLLAALLAIRALHNNSPPLMLAASIFFCLACLSSYGVMPWWPLLLLAPWCWSVAAGLRRRLNRYPIALAPVLLFAFPYVASFSASFWSGEGGGISTLSIGDALANQLFLDRRIVPLPMIVLTVAGLLALARRHILLALPILYAYFGVEWVLSGQNLLFEAYPTRLINAFPSLYLCPLLAAAAAERLVELVAARGADPRCRALTTAAIVAVMVIGNLQTPEAWAYLRTSTAIGRELRFLSTSLADLPAHDGLLLAPMFQHHSPLEEEYAECHDPIEIAFPLAEYRARFPSNPIVAIDSLLSGDATGRLRRYGPDPKLLVYAGVALRSWRWIAGREHESLPADFDRPILQQLRRRYRLEPVLVTNMPTDDHHMVENRLGGAMTDAVEIGFYRMHRRGRPAR